MGIRITASALYICDECDLRLDGQVSIRDERVSVARPLGWSSTGPVLCPACSKGECWVDVHGPWRGERMRVLRVTEKFVEVRGDKTIRLSRANRMSGNFSVGMRDMDRAVAWAKAKNGCGGSAK